MPNFVIQGGSPGANEYDGRRACTCGTRSAAWRNRRGTVGLSTRGRDTGDAQFFINLVDNPRLDFDYTVFGQVDAGSTSWTGSSKATRSPHHVQEVPDDRERRAVER